MCGHVGYIRKVWKTTAAEDTAISMAIKTLLYIDTLRGDHGTGVQVFKREWNNNLQPKPGHQIMRHIFKDAVPGHEFITRQEYRNLTGTVGPVIAVLGHNRYSTGGAHTIDNTHPFVEGKICLQHNGVVTNSYSVAGKHVPVDSMAIAIALGRGDTLEDVLEEAEGKWCFVWTDLANTSVHFYRNKHRPLWFADCKHGLFYASEKEFLEFALSRAGINDVTYTELPPFVHLTYTFHYGHLAEFGTEKPLWTLRTKELQIEQRKPVKPVHSTVAYTRYYDYDDETVTVTPAKKPDAVVVTGNLLEKKSESEDVNVPPHARSWVDQMREVVKNTRLLSGVTQSHLRGEKIHPMNTKEKMMHALTTQRWAKGEVVFFCYSDHNSIAPCGSFPNLHTEVHQVNGESALAGQAHITISGYARKEEIATATYHKLMLVGQIKDVEDIGGIKLVEMEYIRCNIWADPLFQQSLEEKTHG